MKKDIAVVGVGEAGVGVARGGMSAFDLAGQATALALQDAGITKNEIDGFFAATAYSSTASMDMAEYLGIAPSYSSGSNTGGSSFISHLLQATAAIQAGYCSTALIVYGSTQRSDGGKLVSPTRQSPYEEPYSPRYPISMYALAASRHMHLYGTTREDLAHVAVAARQWAQHNPYAYRRDELSVQDVLESRMLSTPLTVLDTCLVTDGAGAVIVTKRERALDTKNQPVLVSGVAETHRHRHISQMDDLTSTAAVETGGKALKQAGLRPSDIDVAQIYDAFTISTLMFLEDLGFCAKGEGGDFVASGAIHPGGSLPVNTNGGGLSYCHPGMNGIFLLIEAVRQLRGESNGLQIKNAETALVHGNGGTFSAQATAILTV